MISRVLPLEMMAKPFLSSLAFGMKYILRVKSGSIITKGRGEKEYLSPCYVTWCVHRG
ncbi:Uncharacterised protein [Vibrio cholerae]|nr:Uncharacterised protein [Vibrio cholerae]CSI70110.1 Uncharacterised protein [Vibrio cholerae]